MKTFHKMQIRREVNKMRDYWFVYESEDGDIEFFVETTSREEAWKIATENFDTGNGVGCLCLMCDISPSEAEYIGLDTY